MDLAKVGMEVDKEAVDSSAGIFCLLDRRLDEVGLGGLLSLAALRFRAGVAESACAGESSACAESGAEAELGGFCAAWLAAWRAEDLVILEDISMCREKELKGFDQAETIAGGARAEVVWFANKAVVHPNSCGSAAVAR
jgi:hypothetical protein